jgi:arylsulfatase A-like enzyme
VRRDLSLSSVRGALLACLLLGVLGAPGCRPASRSAQPTSNLVLIVVDTLRADRLGCYGWHEDTSPNIDGLARDGVLFERMLCHVPQTLPSFSSILTGTHPPTHGVRTNGIFSLPGSAVTLAEALRNAGYRTGAFVAGFPLDARFGIDQGFETYGDQMRTVRVHSDRPDNEDWLGHGTDAFETSADLITDDAMRWLEGKDARPFFLMVHYFDPHHDYVPPAGYTDFEHPYSGEVAFADAQIGRLLARLEELGHREDTIVAFTADHGECLGEHGRKEHQAVLFEAALHVPFVLRLPPGVSPPETPAPGTPTGARVKGTCGSVDIMPTLLDLCRVRIPGAVEGSSLVGTIDAGRTERDEAYFESLYGALEVDARVTRTGFARGPWKLIRNVARDPESGREAQAFELFNLSQDPDELRNLATRRSAVVDKLRSALEEFERAHPPGSADVITPDRGVIEKLKALGYF